MSNKINLEIARISVAAKELIKDVAEGDYYDGILDAIAEAVSIAKSFSNYSGAEKKAFVIAGLKFAVKELKEEGYLTFMTGTIEMLIMDVTLPNLVEYTYKLSKDK